MEGLVGGSSLTRIPESPTHSPPRDAVQTAEGVVRQDLEYISEQLASEFADMSGRRLLITGGAGFLGYYLVQAVLHWNTGVDDNRRIELVVLDNLMRGLPTWLKALESDPSLTLVPHDIRNPLPAEIRPCDYLIHAASIASPIYYRRYPIETMDANVLGLRHLLDHCVQRKLNGGDAIEGFLFYSSSEIYGDPDPSHIPTPETFRGNVSCTGPRACYDESKRFGETLCVNFAQVHDLPIKTARPFNNYGPGLKITDRRVLPDFARNILSHEDIVMLSDGTATRTYCYIADAIVGYYKVLVRGRPAESYNIGVESPEISIADLAEKVVAIATELFDYVGRVVHRVSDDPQYLMDNPNRRCPDITKARSELAYDPGIGLEEGLRRSLLWYRDNRDAEDS